MQMIYAFRSRELYPHHDGSAFPVELPPTEVRGEWLRQVKSIGFEGLELSLADLRERGAAEQDEIVRELADAGLPCVAIRGGGGMHHPRVAQQNRAALEAGVELAARIGAKVFNTLTNSPAVTGRPGADRGEATSQGSSRDASESDYRRNAEGLARIAGQAAAAGVDMSIEVHQNTICDNSWSTIHLLELIDRPNVGANPDLGNVYWTYDVPEQTCEEAIVALAPHANYWHLKNLIRVHVPEIRRAIFLRRPLPDGEINYRFAVAAMVAAGYDGYVAIEGMKMGDQLSDDRRSFERAKALIEECTAPTA